MVTLFPSNRVDDTLKAIQ